jgi:hypothetical protein
MAGFRREVGERHPEGAADLGVQMVDLAREAVGRQPFGHGIRIEEGAKNLLRLGSEYTMQTDGISGHDVVLLGRAACVTNGVGLLSFCSKDAWPPRLPTSKPGIFPRIFR